MPAAGGAPFPPQPGGQKPRSGPSGKLAALVVGAALVVLVGVGAAVWAFTGGDADSVSEVADDAVAAAQELDVDAGIDLLCEAPSAEEREVLEDAIAQAREDAGTDSPDVDYKISDVEGDEEGSFVVHISSDEPGLQDEETYGAASVKAIVESKDGRSCIASFDSVD